jgi:tRNA1(Val) A37 N6-methylase TrmN6
MTTPEEIFVLNRRVRLFQPPGGFRTSLDSVMLAAACPAKAGERVLDMGAGVGGASFCLLARMPDCLVTGVEIQPDYHVLAVENIKLNKGSADFICADVHGFEAERFDHIICNPPYLEAGTHTRSPDEGRAAANGHDRESLSAWIDTAFRLLKSNGSLTVIHRADMTDKIILAMRKRFGALDIIPLWPRQGEAAKRVIIRAIKDRRSPCILHAGIVLHGPDGIYTDEAENILRDAGSIGLK